MTLIDSLSLPQQKMIRSVVAGDPNYLQSHAASTLRALVRMGFCVEPDPASKHIATDAGRALIDEDALRHQTAKNFHAGESAEYSRWHPRNGVYTHEWVRATIYSADVYSDHVSLKFDDGTYRTVFARHVRKAAG